MFQIWFHLCQLVYVGFLVLAVGALMSNWYLTQIGMWLVVPICSIGAVLGGIWCARGLRSACPLCDQVGQWVAPDKNALAIECSQCGLVGGYVIRDLRVRVLDELKERQCENP